MAQALRIVALANGLTARIGAEAVDRMIAEPLAAGMAETERLHYRLMPDGRGAGRMTP